MTKKKFELFVNEQVDLLINDHISKNKYHQRFLEADKTSSLELLLQQDVFAKEHFMDSENVHTKYVIQQIDETHSTGFYQIYCHKRFTTSEISLLREKFKFEFIASLAQFGSIINEVNDLPAHDKALYLYAQKVYNRLVKARKKS